MSVVEQDVASRAAAPLNLPWGVRALAEELPSGRASSSLRLLAQRLERGDSWQAAIRDESLRVPRHVRGLIEASLATPNVAVTLEKFVHFCRRSTQLRREMWLSVAYPLFVMVSVLMLFACFEYFIVGEMAVMYEDVYEDFGLRTPLALPKMTLVMMAWSGPPALILLGLVLLLGILLPAIWIVFRPLWLDVLVHRLPIFGPLWLWGGTVDWCRLLALLLEAGVPLSEALRLTGAGLSSSELRQACGRLAQRVEAGISLADAVAITPPLPAGLMPVVQWGEGRSALPDALVAAAEMYEGRVRTQLAFVRVFLPPWVFLLVGGVVLLSVIIIFLPIISLINGLL